MSTKHKKHAKLTRPDFGYFGRNELALIGAPCGAIQQTSRRIISALSNQYALTYMDADHASFDRQEEHPYLNEGAGLFVLDKQNAYTSTTPAVESRFDRHALFNMYDLVLVNGNHFEAATQLVYLDTKKLKSLEKRVGQLTNVLGFVCVDMDEPPTSVKEAVGNWKDLPRFANNDEEAVVQHVKNWLVSKRPPLNALILGGGRSTRMGRDKSKIKYRQEEQALAMARLAEPFAEEVFISARADQEFDYPYSRLNDKLDGLGPMGGILTAMQHDPNRAWLVLACDLPFIESKTLEQLVSNRSTKHIATAFLNEESGFAEPLITIWEPKSYLRLVQFLAQGYSCPRKVLINSQTHLITPNDSSHLLNVNTPEEYDLAVQKIQANG
ncbi:MAG: NTP transferase domain-containing protein [Bacteroidia bacterium]|nr:NTP transferase domain-containing protein [Bacteroidia bacterium]